jgi:MFS family permease
MSLLFDSLFSSIALSHFMVDVFNSSRPVLLTYLGLSETQIALISTIYIWTSAMTQPFFGWASDRIGPRWLAAGGVYRRGTGTRDRRTHLSYRCRARLFLLSSCWHNPSHSAGTASHGWS